jgi:ADP-ribosylglycohydrolase
MNPLDPCFSRACGSMMGCVVGDALGAPFEFQPLNYKANDCKGFNTAASHFHLRPGMWTDDASMAGCLADSLITRQRFDPVDCRLRFHHWWHHGYCNAFAKDPARYLFLLNFFVLQIPLDLVEIFQCQFMNSQLQKNQ